MDHDWAKLDTPKESDGDYDDSLTPEKFAEEMEKAKAEGFTVISGAPDLLLLDLDDEDALKAYYERCDEMLSVFDHIEKERYHSKSGVGWHVILKLTVPIPDPARRIALQAALGSDPKREWLSIARLENGITEPSRLFKPNPKKE